MMWIAIAIGGALGALARHTVNLLVVHRLERSVPYATLVVNVVGCVVIGALAGRIAERPIASIAANANLPVRGILGGFTTFSSFGLDTFTLAHGGDYRSAIWNVVAQVSLGVGGVWLGFYLRL